VKWNIFEVYKFSYWAMHKVHLKVQNKKKSMEVFTTKTDLKD